MSLKLQLFDLLLQRTALLLQLRLSFIELCLELLQHLSALHPSSLFLHNALFQAADLLGRIPVLFIRLLQPLLIRFK
ncbi:hypothetical protein, partial [Comamonas kerstersii]